MAKKNSKKRKADHQIHSNNNNNDSKSNKKQVTSITTATKSTTGTSAAAAAAAAPPPTPTTPRKVPRCWWENETLACVASPWGPIQTPVISPLLQDILLERFEKELVQRYPCWLSVQRPRRRRRRRRQESTCNNNDNDVVIGAAKRRNGSKMDRINHTLTDDERRTQSLLRSRILYGTNQCTRALEAAIKAQHQQSHLLPSNSLSSVPPQTESHSTSLSSSCKTPSLIILARDVYPPTMLAHIPVMARQLGTPVVLLPRNASWELGRLLHTRRVAVIVFLPKSSSSPIQTQQRPKSDVTESAAANEGVVLTTTIITMDDGNESKVSSTMDEQTNAALDSFIDFVRSKSASPMLQY